MSVAMSSDEDAPTILDLARQYAARGWRPFPVEYGGKRPAVGVKWGTATATMPTDATLRLWFGRDPVNIGIAAKGSNLVILDQDSADGMRRLCDAYGRPEPSTYRVRTSKGWHWYFEAPPDAPISNKPGYLADFGFDVRGGAGADGQGDGGYVVGAGSMHESGAVYIAENPDTEVAELPEWLLALLLAQGEPEIAGSPAPAAEPARDRTPFTEAQARAYVKGPLEKLRTIGVGGRNDALNSAACAVGHFVPTLWDEESVAAGLVTEAEAVGLDAREIGPTIRSGLRKGMSEPYPITNSPFTPAPENSREDVTGADASPDSSTDQLASWTPVDLTPYVDGTVSRPETALGARRRDGLRFFYPGLEHAVIGETEGGKTWFLLASAAEELVAGNRVVYIHFEENDPGPTVSRLVRQFRVPRGRILEDFLFFGPEHPVPEGRIADLCAERVPALVVLDGQNEAMALHGQKINDPDGAADFRRKLVKPWTRRGAAVASADHVVKDPNANGNGYALGSVHKLNGLSGAGFLVENREAFGEGMKGNSGIYVVKDRPGQLRKAGKPTLVARKYHVAEMVIDDTGEQWSFVLHAPSADDGPDPEFEQMRQDKKQRDLDNEVFEVAAELIRKGLDVSSSMVAANTSRQKKAVLDSLHRLVAAERIVNTSYGQAARYDLPAEPTEKR
jgi:hypothetical protein